MKAVSSEPRTFWSHLLYPPLALLYILGFVSPALADWEEPVAASSGFPWEAMAAVAILIGTAALLLHYLRKRAARLGFHGEPELAVLSTTQVAGRWQLALVQARGRFFLVSGGAQGVHLLAEVSEEAARYPIQIEEEPLLAEELAEPADPPRYTDDKSRFGRHSQDTSAVPRESRSEFDPDKPTGRDARAKANPWPVESPKDSATRERINRLEGASSRRNSEGSAASGRTLTSRSASSPDRLRLADEAAGELALIRQRLARYRGLQDASAADD